LAPGSIPKNAPEKLVGVKRSSLFVLVIKDKQRKFFTALTPDGRLADED
jgi:hypothetical protein